MSRSEAWWFLGAKVTSLDAAVEVRGFRIPPDGSIVAEPRTGPGGLRPDR
ncbi:hypothetical protein [Saccharothrix sp. S26]|nr:hypothetical protein [Saccharothrix sp. S26]